MLKKIIGKLYEQNKPRELEQRKELLKTNKPKQKKGMKFSFKWKCKNINVHNSRLIKQIYTIAYMIQYQDTSEHKCFR